MSLLNWRYINLQLSLPLYAKDFSSQICIESLSKTEDHNKPDCFIQMLVFLSGFAWKVKRFCRYHADLSYNGTQTFPAPVEFRAWKRGRYLTSLFVNADSDSECYIWNAPD